MIRVNDRFGPCLGQSNLWRRMATVLMAGLMWVVVGCGGDHSSGNASTSSASAGMSVPASISSITPSSGPVGTQVVITGVGLNTVTSARVGGVAAAFVIESSTRLRLTVPVGTVGGRVEVTAATGVAAGVVVSATNFTVTPPPAMTVSALMPANVLRGQALTVVGTSLLRATTVIFGGGVSAAVATHSGELSLTVVVPVGATSGTITVSAGPGDTATSTSALTVVDPIVVTPQTYTVAPGANVTLTGTGLMQVSAVTASGVAAVIVSKTATQLVFTLPAGVGCGPLMLRSNSQPAVAAGTVVLNTGCGAARNAGVEVAQVLSQTTGDGRQRLVPGKETWVRVFAVSESADAAAPAMRVLGFNQGIALGAVSLVGPGTLPQLSANGSVTQSMRDDESRSYNAELPASWIASGLSLRVEIDPMQQWGPTQVTEVAPTVGGNSSIDLVLVPLISGANVPTMPDLEEVLNELTRRLPVARERIVVSLRAPYTLTSVTDGVDTSTEWSLALSELENLRRAEAPGKHYYGMVRPMVSAGTAGVGYVNNVGATTPAISSLGWDASRNSWRRTMVHELGHNFGRPHAPCGGAASPDPNYPYAGGLLGTTPLFDSLSNDVIAAASMADIMGYCNGSWFSDYNLREVQRFLEARPQPVGQFASTRTSLSEVWVVSGVIDDAGVRLAPVYAMRAAAPAPTAAAGVHSLRLATRAGAVMDVPFDTYEVDHANGEQHFFVRVPSPGTLDSITVHHGGQALPMVASDRVWATKAVTRAAAQDAAVAASVRGGDMQITWNRDAVSFVTVAWVAGAERRTLAMNAQTGHVSVPLTSLPPGGAIEVSLSDGINARTVTLPRP